MKLRWGWSAGLVSLLVAGRVAGQAPPSDATTKRAQVTAVTSDLVYVAAGRDDGLREGAVIQVRRLGAKGQYRVVYLSSKSSASRGDSLAQLPNVGDTVEFTAATASAVAARGGPTGNEQRLSRRGDRPRGRVGIRYLQNTEHGPSATLRQPGVELLVEGALGAGVPLGVSIDVRPRRTMTSRAGGPLLRETITGVYQAAVRFQEQGGPLRATIGRQYAPTLAGVGLFDGVAIEVQRRRWGTGVMAGLAPEPGTLAVSSAIRQLGGYFQGRSSAMARTRWSLTGGAMASYADAGEVNREFGFVQGTLFTKGVSAIALQEVDLNRGWKLAAGEPRLSPTSSYLSASLTPTPWFVLSGGVDSRRAVRLYRDLTTPEAVFDDRYRRGTWASAHLTIARRIRVGGDWRRRSVEGTDSLSASAYSGTLSVDRLTPIGFGLRARATRYQTPGRGTGTLLVGGLRIAPARFGNLELSAGRRTEAAAAAADRWWIGGDADLVLGRSWLWLASYSKEWGRDQLTPTTTYLYTGVSYRF